MPRKITNIYVYEADGYGRAGGDEIQVDGSNDLKPYLGRHVQIRHKLGKPSEMRFSVVRGSAWHSQNLLVHRVRLYVAFDDASVEPWRIRSVQTQTNGTADVEVMAWPLWTDLGDTILRKVRDPEPVVSYALPFHGITLNDALDIVFNEDYGINAAVFKKGTVESPLGSDTVAIDANASSHLAILHALCEYAECEFETTFSSASDIIRYNIVSKVGQQNAASDRMIHGPVGDGSTSSNRESLVFTDVHDDFYTRLVPFAGDEREPIGIGGLRWTITDYVDTVPGSKMRLYFEQSGSGSPVAGNVAYKSGALNTLGATIHAASIQKALVESTSASDNSIVVLTDVPVVPGSDYVVFGDNTGSDLVTGEWPHLTFLPDYVAEQSKGAVWRSVFFNDIPPYANLFEELVGGSGDMSTGTPLPDGMNAVDALGVADIKRLEAGTPGNIFVHGDHSAWISAPETIGVAGTVYNDGSYTVNSDSYNAASDHTAIGLVENIGSDEREIGTVTYTKTVTTASVTTGYDVRYGDKSLKVNAEYGGGVKTDDLTFNFGSDWPYLSVWSSIRVAEGKVRVVMEKADGTRLPGGVTQAESTANTLLALSIGGMEHDDWLIGSDPWYVLFEAREDGTIFYVDALAVTNSPTPWEYAENMGPRALWIRAAQEIVETGGLQPPEYQSDFFDPEHLNLGSEVTLGAVVEIKDLHHNGTPSINTTGRVVDLIEEEHPIDGRLYKTVRISRERPRLSDRLKPTAPLSKTGGAPPVEIPLGAIPTISSESEFATQDIDDGYLLWTNTQRGGIFIHNAAGISANANNGTTFPAVDGGTWDRIYADAWQLNWWDVDPTGANDATTVINSVLQYASDINPSAESSAGTRPVTVYGQGRYLISDTIIIPNKVALKGLGPRSQNFIFADTITSNWNDKRPMVSLGDYAAGDTNTFGNLLENWHIGGQDVAYVGVESLHANEQSGCRFVTCRNMRSRPFDFRHTSGAALNTLSGTYPNYSSDHYTYDETRIGYAHNYIIEHCEGSLSDTTTVDGGTAFFLLQTNTGKVTLRNITTNVHLLTSLTGATIRGVRLNGLRGTTVENIHTENTGLIGVEIGDIQGCNSLHINGFIGHKSHNCGIHVTDATGIRVSAAFNTVQPDSPATGSITATANGSGEIRCTAASHGLTTGDYVDIRDFANTPNGNNVYRVTVIDPSTFDLDDSVWLSSYSSDTATFAQCNVIIHDEAYGRIVGRKDRGECAGYEADESGIHTTGPTNYGNRVVAQKSTGGKGLLSLHLDNEDRADDTILLIQADKSAVTQNIVVVKANGQVVSTAESVNAHFLGQLRGDTTGRIELWSGAYGQLRIGNGSDTPVITLTPPIISSGSDFATAMIEPPWLFWNDPLRGGLFYYDASTGSDTIDGGTIFAARNGKVWRRQYAGPWMLNWWDVDPTGATTGQQTEINNALAKAYEANIAARDGNARPVTKVIGNGKYKISGLVRVPHTVCFEGGSGRGDCWLVADSAATWTDTPMVEIGGLRTQPPYSEPDSNAFGALLTGWSLACDGYAVMGVESFYANENSGVSNCFIRYPRRFGIMFVHTGAYTDFADWRTTLSAPSWLTTRDNTRAGRAQNWHIDNVEVTFGDSTQVDDGASALMLIGSGADGTKVSRFSLTGKGDLSTYTTLGDTGTAQAGSDTTITLATGASGTDDYYNHTYVRITAGTGSGQERYVTDYDGTSKVATVESDWTTNPDATSVYHVGVDVAAARLEGMSAFGLEWGHIENFTSGVKAGDVQACGAFAVSNVSSNPDVRDHVWIGPADANAVRTERYVLQNIQGDGINTLRDNEKSQILTTGVSHLAASASGRFVTNELLPNVFALPDGTASSVVTAIRSGAVEGLFRGINRRGTTAVYQDRLIAYSYDAGSGDVTEMYISGDDIYMHGMDVIEVAAAGTMHFARGASADVFLNRGSEERIQLVADETRLKNAHVRLDNAKQLEWRNGSDTADVRVLQLTSVNGINIGAAGVVGDTIIYANGAIVVQNTATHHQIKGVNVRLDNNKVVQFRNASDLVNVNSLSLNTADDIIIGDTSGNSDNVNVWAWGSRKMQFGNGFTYADQPIRMDNDDAILWRNGSDTVNLIGIEIDGNDVTILGNSSNPVDIQGSGLRPARGTSFPGSPVDGEEFYRSDLDEKFYYDGTRAKWLSVWVGQLGAGASGTLGASTYLRRYNGMAMTASTRGYYLPFDITVVGYMYHVDATASGSFRVRRNGTKQFGIPHNVATQGNSWSTDVDILANGNIAIFNNASGSVANPAVEVYYRRKAT